MAIVAAFALAVLLISPTSAQEAISCEGWTAANGQSLKIVSEIKGWIIQYVRKAAGEMATTSLSLKGVACADLACMKDGDILAEVDDFCSKYPGYPLRNAVDDSAFALAESRSFINRTTKNSN
jgi:hypothetical protein